MTDREKFLTQLTLEQKEREHVDTAYMFAKYGHRTQTRDDGTRYFEHPRAVANIIIQELGIVNEWKLVVTALLHDILEDTWLLDERRLKRNFGKNVAEWVVCLTKRRGVNYHQSLALCTRWQVLLVKLADRLHNIRTLNGCTSAKQKKYLQETKEHYLPFAEQLIQLLPRTRRVWGIMLKEKIETELLGYTETT